MQEVFSSDNIFVRFSGSKFCIVSPGISADTLHSTVERYLTNVKMQEEIVNNERVNLNVNIVMKNIRKQSNIEREISKMADYVEQMKVVNTIKII